MTKFDTAYVFRYVKNNTGIVNICRDLYHTIRQYSLHEMNREWQVIFSKPYWLENNDATTIFTHCITCMKTVNKLNEKRYMIFISTYMNKMNCVYAMIQYFKSIQDRWQPGPKQWIFGMNPAPGKGSSSCDRILTPSDLTQWYFIILNSDTMIICL